MGQAVARAEFEQAFAPQPGATEAGRAAQILLRMGLRPIIRHLQMGGNALAGQPGQQGGMTVRVKTGIEVHGHELEAEGHNTLADFQGLEQHKAVHAAGYGHSHPAAGPKHAGFLHGLARAFDADLLGEGAFLAAHGRSSL